MAWRWFYSTEESDTALKAILDASKFSKEYTRNENGLTDGVYEYKVWIEQDSEFVLLASKIDLAKIRALASPERVTQFGNIRPDNYFDSTKYAAGCAYRDTDTLAHMIAFLAWFKIGTQIAQRDLDVQGSASLGTVALTLSALYKKTYNIPVNGSVSDRTLVKAIIDSTAPAVTQTNATCNQAMFDFSDMGGIYPEPSNTGCSFGSGSFSEWVSVSRDKKISVASTTSMSASAPDYSAIVAYDFSTIATRNIYVLYDYVSTGVGQTINLETSNDNISWNTLETDTYGSSSGTYVEMVQLSKTFRYVRLRIAGSAISIKIREILILII